MKKLFYFLLFISFSHSYSQDCRYIKNEKDEFTNKKVIKSDWYNLKSKDDLYIMLRNINNKKSIVFTLDRDLGCAVSYKGRKSSAKIKLENGVIVSFYHNAQTDCGDFTLIGRLTENDIKKLKASPIKTIRFQGTKYYHDTKDISYKTFFIEKLDCIK